MANVTVLNTTANLSGKTIAVAENTHSITGAWTFANHLIFTDATYDIGASGATRPRDLYLSRNAVIGGTLAVTGATTLSSTLAVTGASTLNGAVTLGDAAGDAVTITGVLTGTLRGPQLSGMCQGRLTLTTATPVTTADVTGATTMYFTPYGGHQIALYDGTDWVLHNFTEISLALGTLTSGLPYDVFCYSSSGTATLEFLAWTNGTTRATALALQNGVLSKTGALTRRYLGTFYTTSTTATEDSAAKRFVWNYYNRVPRPMKVFEATDTWGYDTDTVRQARASTANQLAVVIGVNEVPVQVTLTAIARHSATGTISVGIGVDSTTATAGTTARAGLTTATTTVSVHYAGFPGLGYHFLAWLERGGGATTTFVGDETSADYNQSGLFGWIMG